MQRNHCKTISNLLHPFPAENQLHLYIPNFGKNPIYNFFTEKNSLNQSKNKFANLTTSSRLHDMSGFSRIVTCGSVSADRQTWDLDVMFSFVSFRSSGVHTLSSHILQTNRRGWAQRSVWVSPIYLIHGSDILKALIILGGNRRFLASALPGVSRHNKRASQRRAKRKIDNFSVRSFQRVILTKAVSKPKLHQLHYL
jgi:hypothetical protein